MSILVERALAYLWHGRSPVKTILVGTALVLTVEHGSAPFGSASALAFLSLLVLIGYLTLVLQDRATGGRSAPTFDAPLHLAWRGARAAYVLARYVLSRAGYRYFESLPWTRAALVLGPLLGLFLLVVYLLPAESSRALFDAYVSLLNSVRIFLGFAPYDETTLVPVVLGPPVFGVLVTLLVAVYGLPAALVLAAGEPYYAAGEFGEKLHDVVFTRRYVYGWLTLFALLLIDVSAGLVLLAGTGMSLGVFSLGRALLGAALDFYVLVAVAYVFGDVVGDPARGARQRRPVKRGWQAKLPEYSEPSPSRRRALRIRLRRHVCRIRDTVLY